MKTINLVITASVAAATFAMANPAAAALTVPYQQVSAFLFNESVPQNTFIGRFDGDLGLTPPSGADAGSTYESLFWGNDVTVREQHGLSTPIETTPTSDPFVWNATAAWWTSNSTPDSALKVVGLSGTITSVHSYVAPGNPGWVPISVTFHSNQTIYVENDGLLTSGVVRSNLTVDGVMDPHDLLFTFYETPNGDAAYNCPDGSGVSCDIFQFPLSSFQAVPVSINGGWYELYFDLLYLSPGAFNITGNTSWGNGACQAGNFCVLTKEGQVNYLVTGMLLVPEPASLALVGLGLVGLAGMRRRKVY